MRRLPQIDALRGLMLVLMTLTHMPTRFSDPLGQPLGFVSAAEGFVFLSAFLAAYVGIGRGVRRAIADEREPHWITSSARSNSGCGIARSSDLAVFRLMTSSMRRGCSTGRSAGLV